jgi:hypothetical protein
MRGLLLAIAVALGGYGALAPSAVAAIAHPNPVLVQVPLDYVSPLVGPSGTPVVLAHLSRAIIAQAVADQRYLTFTSAGDLGGFGGAPVGQSALTSGGHDIVGGANGQSQLQPLSVTPGGGPSTFVAPATAPFLPPENGTQPVTGLGVPPPVTPPANTNAAPPPNQSFGGVTPPPPPPVTTTTTTPTTTSAPPVKKPPPVTTTPTTTTTTTATTATTTAAAPTPPAATPTTTASTPTPPPPSGAACGVTGLTITSDHATCQLSATNMAPGGSTSEVLAIRNDSDAAFTLSLQVSGTPNQLWNDLELGVWEAGSAAPAVLPGLLTWTGQDNDLVVLQAGQSVSYELELYLPASAGNTDQGLAASIDLVWTAAGT